MKAISNDLRQRIVDHYSTVAGATLSSTSELFRVGRATVNRLVQRYHRKGSIDPDKHGRLDKFKIDKAWLRKKTEATPDFTIKMLVEALAAEKNINVGISTMWYALQSINISHKKNSFFKGA